MVNCGFRPGGKLQAVRKFLATHGDDIPAEDIPKAANESNLSNWTVLCDAAEKVAAAMRWEQNDWYLCTIKNAAVRPDLRGKGIGSRMYKEVADHALQQPNCHMLAGDITEDNIGSIRAAEKAGMVKVSDFCWMKGSKPARVYHFVRYRPSNASCP